MIKHIADNMRSADVVEVWEMSRHTPLESIQKGLDISHLKSVAIIEGVPCAVFGLVKVDLLTGTGVPWLLGTDHAVKHRRIFLESCKQGICQMLQECPNLYNYVHAENRLSVRWLKYMGFTIHEPEVMGLGNTLFHKFTKEV